MYENIYCAFCKGRRVLTEHFGGADLCELGISKEEPGKIITGLLDFTMNNKEAPVLRHANECSCLETFDYYRVRSYLSLQLFYTLLKIFKGTLGVLPLARVGLIRQNMFFLWFVW